MSTERGKPQVIAAAGALVRTVARDAGETAVVAMDKGSAVRAPRGVAAHPEIGGAAPPSAATVLPPTVTPSRTCRCTPPETSRALIRRASHPCAALLFAAVFSLEPVYLHVQEPGGRAHLPADRPPPLPRVRLRARPDERHVPCPRAPHAPRCPAPRAVRPVRGDHRAHCPRADERTCRATPAAEPAARPRPAPRLRPGSRTAAGPGRTEPRRGRLGPDRSAGLAVAVRSATAPGAPGPVGAGAGGGHVPVRPAPRIPVRPGRLIAEAAFRRLAHSRRPPPEQVPEAAGDELDAG